MSTFEPKAEQIMDGLTGSAVFTRAGNDPSLATQSANAVFAGPASGAAAQPTFRALGLADLPGTFARILYSARQTSDQTGAGDLTVLTYSVPANTLGSGNRIRVMASLRKISGTSNVTVKVSYGGTNIYTGVATAYAANAVARLDIDLWGNGATNAQRSNITIFTTGTGKHTTPAATGTSAVDSTSAQNLVVTMAVVTTTDHVGCDYATVELMT